MDKGGEVFVLVMGDVGVEGLDRVVGCAVVWEKRRRRGGKGGLDGGVALRYEIVVCEFYTDEVLVPIPNLQSCMDRRAEGQR